MEPEIINTDTWIEKNSKLFQPPVCNKLMHNEQLSVFFVGGPNVRKDYHLEEGPEFFHMIKGDMCLKVLEQGKHRDIHIKEGQVFFLPPCVPHSPQRQSNTVGLVIERRREEKEMDGLRYFVENNGVKTTEILYEKWFHCTDLGPQLSAAVKEFFETEQSKTGIPIPGTILPDPPIDVNNKIQLNEPFYLQDWIKENEELLNNPDTNIQPLFTNMIQSQIFVRGNGEHSDSSHNGNIWLWQLKGQSSLTVGSSNRLFQLKEKDSVLLPPNVPYTLKVKTDSYCLSVAQHREF